MRSHSKAFILLLLALAVFLVFLNGPDIVTSHEARVALPARQMADSGWPWAAQPVLVPPVKLQTGIVRLAPDWSAPRISVNPWLVPVMSGQIRLQKPPLPYWCAAVCFRVLGGFSETNVRLIPALLGALATLLIMDLGRVLYGRRIGWLAGLVWISTYSIPEEYRKAMADPHLAFFTLGCVWSWIQAAKAREKNRGETRFLLCFYLSFAMALLAKGPPAIPDILIPLAAFHLCTRSPVPRKLGGHLAGIALLVLIALPWPLYALKNLPHAMELWRYESVGELADNTENARPWSFYLPQILYVALPWTAVWAVGIARQFERLYKSWIDRHVAARLARRGELTSHAVAMERSHAKQFFPLVWQAAMLIFFSFVNLKKNQYLLPGMPAQTLIIAQGLGVLLGGLRRKKFKGQSGALAMLQVILAIGFGVAIVALPILGGIFGFIMPVSFGGTIVPSILLGGRAAALAIAISIIALLISLLPLWQIAARRPRGWIWIQSAVYVALFLAFSRTYLTPTEAHRSPKQVAGELFELSHRPGYTLLATRLPEEVAVYLPIETSYDDRAKHVLVIVDDQHAANLRVHGHGASTIPTPELKGYVSEGRVTDIQRMPLKTAPGDARWKVWDLTVDRSVFTRADEAGPSLPIARFIGGD